MLSPAASSATVTIVASSSALNDAVPLAALKCTPAIADWLTVRYATVSALPVIARVILNPLLTLEIVYAVVH